MLLSSYAIAGEVVFRDDLATGGKLLDRELSSGGKKWYAESSVAIAEGGGASTGPNGGSAAFDIPRIAGVYILHAKLKPAQDGSVSLSFGGDRLVGAGYYAARGLSVGMARGGVYEIRVKGDKAPLRAGSAKDYGGLPEGGVVPVELVFNNVSQTLTVKLNGKAVVENMSLAGKGSPGAFTRFGFHVSGPVKDQDIRVSDITLTLAAATTSGLSVVDAAQFFVTPDAKSTITWKADSIAGETLKFELTNYAGQPAASGSAKVDASGVVTAEFAVPIGYYDLRFPETGETFGVVSLPAVGNDDSFFGIDAGLTWLEPRNDVRDAMVKIFRRSGINAARERLSWGNADATIASGNWDAGQRADALRKAYADSGVKILEILYGGGAKYRFDTPGEYPQRFGPAAVSWTKIAQHWGGNWAGDEIWNEPDLVQMPADQYVPAIKLAAYVHDQAKIAAPVVGGAFTGISPATYHDVAAANGMLDASDAISFHTYDNAIELTNVVGKYRAWFAANGKETMPLWLTECGKAWPLGPDRPAADADSLSAHAMAALACEAKAAGIARMFPFVAPYYEEGPKNFGMFGREATPLRCMAAYTNAIRMLAGKPYAGDLPKSGELHSVRVFGEGDEQTVVIYAKKVDANLKVNLGVAIHRVESIDGRPLQVGADGAIPVPDGVAFAVARKADLAPLLQTDTATRKLYQTSLKPGPTKAKLSPVILTYVIDRKTSRLSSRRYLLAEADAQSLKITVRAGNMSDKALKATVRLTLPDGSNRADPVTVDIPALGTTEASWTIDASKALDVAEVRFIKVNGTLDDNTPISTLAIPFLLEGDLQTHLARHSYQSPIAINQLDRWKPNLAENGKMTTTVTPEGVWHLDVNFTPPSSRWLYPVFTLPEPFDAERGRGILMRARILKKARNVAVMLRENNRPGFWAVEIFPADGEWHVVYLPFGEFRPEAGNPDMQNALLKPELIRSIQIGMGSDENENTMEISHLMVVGQERAK